VNMIPPLSCHDGLGHGSMVAGIAAAKDNNIGVVGTAPGARIWALKVMYDNGEGDESDVIKD
jgi:subtilisin